MPTSEPKIFQFTPDLACKYLLADKRVVPAQTPQGLELLPMETLTMLAQNNPIEDVANWVRKNPREIESLGDRNVRGELVRANHLAIARNSTTLVAFDLGLVYLSGRGEHLKDRIQGYQDFEEDLLAERGVGILPTRWYKYVQQQIWLGHWFEVGRELLWAQSEASPHSIPPLETDARFQDNLAAYNQHSEPAYGSLLRVR